MKKKIISKNEGDIARAENEVIQKLNDLKDRFSSSLEGKEHWEREFLINSEMERTIKWWNKDTWITDSRKYATGDETIDAKSRAMMDKLRLASFEIYMMGRDYRLNKKIPGSWPRNPFEHPEFIHGMVNFEYEMFLIGLKRENEKLQLNDQNIESHSSRRFKPTKSFVWNADLNVLVDIFYELMNTVENPDTGKKMITGGNAEVLAEMMCSYFENINSVATIKDYMNSNHRFRNIPKKARVLLSIKK